MVLGLETLNLLRGGVTLCSEIEGVHDFELPIETVYLDQKYNPILLPYYFSGLKEVNPLLNFIGFYNVLEYYFEEAPTLVNKEARGEKEQIECVLLSLVNDQSITDFSPYKIVAIIPLLKVE